VKTCALITGANRGIGFEIARQLAERGMRVVLTARDALRGQEACDRLVADGLDVVFQPLDVTVPEEVETLARWLDKEPGRLDVLVNNAGISVDWDVPATEVAIDQVKGTLETNLIAPWRLCQHLVPLMEKHRYGRIVNVSSGRGSFSKMAATHAAYRISKTGLNALTCILADELRQKNILVNAMTPGWVRTRLGGIRAPRSAAEGADTAVWLATLPDDGPTGGFFKDRSPFPW